MTAAPPRTTFSIVMPAYNRERLVRRAIHSCLRQHHAGVEVIVVDDGSTDGTADAVRAIDDPRVRLVVHRSNVGVCPARNRGIAHARGEWVVFLDSDDELVDGSLETMDGEIRRVKDCVGAVRFMCRLDDGTTSPMPALRREVWDYVAYLRWAESVTPDGRGESLLCVRRSTFDTVKYPDGRALEPLYNMDLAAHFQTATSPAVVRLYHDDAPNQLTSPDVQRALDSAADNAHSLGLLLERHGAALARWAPNLLVQYTRGFATQQFLSGDRLGGVKTMGRLVRRHGRCGTTLGVLALGLLHRRMLARAQARRVAARRKLSSPRVGGDGARQACS